MHEKPNPWKGFVTGVLGAIGGLLAMDYYWEKMAPAVEQQAPDALKQRPGGEESHSLDSITLLGRQYQDEESSTAALGRIIYQWLTGSPPQSEETKTVLSYLVHWGYGMLQGGMYGAVRAGSRVPDLRGGWSYATTLWLFGDEIMVPLLGLQSGPTAVSWVQHLNRWGAHLAYGTGLAVTTQTLQRLL